MNAIFVYGLLKPGFSLHHRIAPYVVRAEAAVAPGRLYAAEYPAARFDQDGEIDGFVMWLDEARTVEALALLDEIEDEGVMYRRLVVRAKTAEEPVDAYAYEYALPLDGCPDAGRCWPE